MFLQVSVILSTGGRAWLPGGCMFAGGMCGCQGGMRGCGGHAWLQGGMRGCGGHAWLQGGMRGCWGACVVGEHAWLLGGMRGCGGHVWLPGGHAWLQGGVGYDEIRSMSGRYATYWNAFLFKVKSLWVHFCLVLTKFNGAFTLNYNEHESSNFPK